MKRRMISAIILFIITFIALLVFIALYMDEVRRVQETYRNQYRTSLGDVIEDIGSYRNGEGDMELRYRRILSDMSGATSFVFLIDDLGDEKKVINEVNTCIMKYPEQMRSKLDELETALQDILDGLDKGYDEAKALVDSIDKQGY
ncbi:hypothetical protein [Ruminococcus sp.]|uniref:hypothetical protein n=1 Tax=Ruminococcus sp. TaxID=41978 RepID=UPI0025CBAE73|nr:hypothetical protein [Ruminococcus sp.]